jgi:hypothetical protein
MRRARQLIHAVLLTAAAVSALADLTVAEAAASHSPSPDPVSSTLVLRGSSDSNEKDAAASDGAAPTVLRGSPPSAVQLHATPYACNPGLDYDANYGCVAPGYSYAPTTDTGPITGTGPVSGLTPAAGVAGSATASLTALAGDERFALVTPSLITALVTASPMPPGSAADSRLEVE